MDGSTAWLTHLSGSTDAVTIKLLCGADLLESFARPGLWKDEDVSVCVGGGGSVGGESVCVCVFWGEGKESWSVRVCVFFGGKCLCVGFFGGEMCVCVCVGLGYCVFILSTVILFILFNILYNNNIY